MTQVQLRTAHQHPVVATEWYPWPLAAFCLRSVTAHAGAAHHHHAAATMADHTWYSFAAEANLLLRICTTRQMLAYKRVVLKSTRSRRLEEPIQNRTEYVMSSTT
jgi:hypothetical protein